MRSQPYLLGRNGSHERTMSDQDLTPEELAAIERKYDSESAFRPHGPVIGKLISVALVAMTLYHVYQAGFGTSPELMRFGVHLAFVLGLTFLLFSWRRSPDTTMPAKTWYRIDGVNILDIVLAVLTVIAALYLPLLPPEVAALRAGDPNLTDTILGSVVLLFTLEAARRSIGPTLPAIALIFVLYAIFGRYAPGPLIHAGVTWSGFVDGIYGSQGIYGIAILSTWPPRLRAGIQVAPPRLRFAPLRLWDQSRGPRLPTR